MKNLPIDDEHMYDGVQVLSCQMLPDLIHYTQ